MSDKKRALLSVFYKDGIVEFARSLIKYGYEIVSSGGTARHLKNHGVGGIIDVADITGVPAILSHRVVTLNHKIYAGILAELTPEHERDLKQFMAERFDIVCCDVYPVWEALTAGRVSVSQVMNMTDIGGPCMLRASAKNHNNCVTSICDPADRQRVIDDIIDFGRVTTKLRMELAAKTFDMTSRYDAAIRDFMMAENGILVDSIFLSDGRRLAYGENRDQSPAYIFSDGSDDELAIDRFKVVSGDPSYISLADGDQLVDILCLMSTAFRNFWFDDLPFIAVAGKHGNPCGVGIDFHSPDTAITKALMGDPVAVMGGEVITNFQIDGFLAKCLFSTRGLLKGKPYNRDNWGLDIIYAPSFDDEAIDLLGRRAKRRLMANNCLEQPFMNNAAWMYRPIRGGMLRQKRANFVLDIKNINDWTGQGMTSRDDLSTLVIAWATCWRASSNTVALAKDRMLIGLGCGQQDRIACVKLCLERARSAGHDPKYAIFASDAFFPYATGNTELIPKRTITSLMNYLEKAADTKDPTLRQRILLDNVAAPLLALETREGTELLRDSGCKGGIVTADGKNLPKVKALFQDAGMQVAFVDAIHRGFSKH